MDKTTLMYTKSKSIDIKDIYKFIVEEFDVEAELGKDGLSGYIEHTDDLEEERYDKIHFKYDGTEMCMAIISNFRTNDLKNTTSNCSVVTKGEELENKVTYANGLEFDSHLCNVIVIQESEISSYILSKIASYFGGGYVGLD